LLGGIRAAGIISLGGDPELHTSLKVVVKLQRLLNEQVAT